MVCNCCTDNRYCCQVDCYEGDCQVPKNAIYIAATTFGQQFPELCNGCDGNGAGDRGCECGLPPQIIRVCHVPFHPYPPASVFDGDGWPVDLPGGFGWIRVGAPCECGTAAILTYWPPNDCPVNPADYVVQCVPLNADGTAPAVLNTYYPGCLVP